MSLPKWEEGLVKDLSENTTPSWFDLLLGFVIKSVLVYIVVFVSFVLIIWFFFATPSN